MKRVIIYIVVAILLIVGLNYSMYQEYGKVTKDITNNLLNSVEIKDKEELINVINGNKTYENDILKDYGFVDSDTTYFKDINKVYHSCLVNSLIIILLIITVILIIEIIIEKKKNKEINEVINYLELINRGIYDLNILNNKEGKISILKNEIYTTTIMLKEYANKQKGEKVKLKESLSNISHQLKTPLTSIILMLDSLLYESIDEQTKKEFLNDIKIQIENINYLILVMLKLSRFDASVVEFKKEEINMKKLIWDVLKNVDILREIKNVNIHIKGSNQITFVGDYKWELEAITNIVKNAIEHTNSGHDIYITYEDYNLYTFLEIKDTGKGISIEDKKHIFERFYKGDNCSENNFGIGLPLAKEIINQDNGTIIVDSKENEGTTFKIKYYKS